MSVDKLLKAYRRTPPERRVEAARRLVSQSPKDSAADEALLYILNEENDEAVAWTIVTHFADTRPLIALRALTKAMFDSDPLIRARAAVGVAAYEDSHLLGVHLAALLDAIPDPVTRSPMEATVRRVTGR